MKYLKQIEYKEHNCIKRILTLEHANGYTATYRESETCTITFSKGKYLECIKDKIIRGIKMKKN